MTHEDNVFAFRDFIAAMDPLFEEADSALHSGDLEAFRSLFNQISDGMAASGEMMRDIEFMQVLAAWCGVNGIFQDNPISKAVSAMEPPLTNKQRDDLISWIISVDNE